VTKAKEAADKAAKQVADDAAQAKAEVDKLKVELEKAKATAGVLAGAADPAKAEKATKDARDAEAVAVKGAKGVGAMAYAFNDGPIVKDASIYGGQRALILTAGVPATMAICYLLLVFYFISKGGYKAVHLDANGNEVEAGH
ncbi:MAG: hypothetical protein ACHRHE_23940, partial [Tepidisphaerales bacterium]